MNEHEEEDQLIADKFEIDKCIGKEVLKLKKKRVKIITQKQFDKLMDKVCVKFDIDVNNELNEDVEEKLLSTLEKNGIKGLISRDYK
jgi:hypothetical protein